MKRWIDRMNKMNEIRKAFCFQPRDERLSAEGDGQKVRLAARLRKDTTMSLKWIQHLALGNWTRLSNRVRPWGHRVRPWGHI
jgi:hypothetical protein